MTQLTDSNLFDYIRQCVAENPEEAYAAVSEKILHAVAAHPNREAIEVEIIDAALDRWISDEPIKDRVALVRKGVMELIELALQTV